MSESESKDISSLAADLVSPSTERAIEDLINNSTSTQVVQNDTVSVSVANPSTNGTTVAQNGHTNGHTNGQVTNVSGSEDNFENLQRAVQILGRAKQLDDVKRYDEALKMYRQGVDMLLEELMVRQGTEQSRSYLRNKCNDFMNRIDQLKLIIEIEKASAENKENNQAKPTPQSPPTTNQ
jgi:hypothetical protein